jgi:hypothetical protein
MLVRKTSSEEQSPAFLVTCCAAPHAPEAADVGDSPVPEAASPTLADVFRYYGAVILQVELLHSLTVKKTHLSCLPIKHAVETYQLG